MIVLGREEEAGSFCCMLQQHPILFKILLSEEGGILLSGHQVVPRLQEEKEVQRLSAHYQSLGKTSLKIKAIWDSSAASTVGPVLLPVGKSCTQVKA